MDLYELNSKINIYYIRNNKLIKKKIKLEESISPIRRIYPVFEQIDYYILGGMVFMNFATNHISLTRKLSYKYYKYNDEKKSKLIVSYIFPNTPVHILNNIKQYNIINKVNDIEINNVSELKKALSKKYKINNIDYIKIENDDNKMLLLPLDELNNIDKKFSTVYNYPLMNNKQEKMKDKKKILTKTKKIILSKSKKLLLNKTKKVILPKKKIIKK